MANQYGLVTDTKKYGTGSFYAPFNTSRTKALRIDPGLVGGDFEIRDGQDFYISVWIKYGTVNVSTPGVRYPIIKYGDQISSFPHTGWEIGIQTMGGQSYYAIPYFRFTTLDNTGVLLASAFDGTNGNLISPTSNFDHYEVIRSNGVITFKFNGFSTSQSTYTYTGPIAYPLQELINNGNLDSSYRGLYVGSEQPYVNGQDNGAYIDELFMARGVSSVQKYDEQDGSINDGALSTTTFLYKFNGNYLDTQTSNVYASANLQSSISFRVDAVYTKPLPVLIQLASISNLVATAKETAQGRANLAVQSALTAQGFKVKQFSANLVSTTTLTETTSVIRRAQARLNALASEMVIVAKTTREVGYFNSSSTLVAGTAKIARITKTLNSTSTLTEVTNRTRGVTANLTAISGISIRANQSGRLQANLISTSTFTAGEIKSVRISALLSSTTSITELTSVIRRAQANLQALVSELTLANETASVHANLTSTTSLICRVGNNASLISRSTMTTNTQVRYQARGRLVSRSILTPLAGKRVIVSSNLSSLSSISIVGSRERIDTSLVWYIETERRDWMIEYEERNLSAEYENRVYIVPTEE